MNVYDSELVKSILTESDYLFTDNIKDASVALLNTCSVRENAIIKCLIEFTKLNAKHIQMGWYFSCMATNFKTNFDNLKRKLI